MRLCLVLAIILSGATPLQAQQDVREFERRILTALRSRPVLQIGRLDGADEEVFGRISYTALDRDGGIVILDTQADRVHRFDRNGVHRGSAGRRGGGPGEFNGPVGLLVDSQFVHVLSIRRKISLFSTRDNALTHVRDQAIETEADDFCRYGDGWFLLAAGFDTIIRRVNSSGKVVAAFGERISTLDLRLEIKETGGGRVFLSRQNNGKLLCLPERNTVVLLPSSAPLIRAFRPDGVEVWRLLLDDYRQVRDVPVPGRAGWRMLGGDPKTGTWHHLTSATVVADGVLALSLSEAGRGKKAVYHMRLVSLANGRVLRKFALPEPIIAITEDRVFTIKSDPFPHILGFALQ